MTQPKVQLEDKDVAEREKDQKILAFDFSNPLQGEAPSLSQNNVNTTTKVKKDGDNQKNSHTNSRPTEKRRTARAKSSKLQSQIEDSKKNNMRNNNTTTQMKIPPYKRDSRKLFVGGLPAGLTGDEFRNIFEKFGSILDSVVIIDRTTKRSRGFGFVTFEDAMVAQKLLHPGKTPTDSAATTGSQSRSIFIRGKRCEIKASEPKEMLSPPTPMNHSSNSLIQPVQNPRSSSEGTSNVESLINHGDASFDRPTSPNDFSAPLHPYSYDVPMHSLHPGNGYQSYPNDHIEEHYDERYGTHSSNYSNINSYDEAASRDQVSPYMEQCDIGVNRGMMTYQNEVSYSPQPFIYGNTGVPYIHQMMPPHVYPYGFMHSMPTTWQHPVFYPIQNECFENSAPIGEKPSNTVV